MRPALKVYGPDVLTSALLCITATGDGNVGPSKYGRRYKAVSRAYMVTHEALGKFYADCAGRDMKCCLAEAPQHTAVAINDTFQSAIVS